MQGELGNVVHGWQPCPRNNPTLRKENTHSDQQLGISARNTEGREFFLVLQLAYMRAQKTLPPLCALKESSSTGHLAWGLVWCSLSDSKPVTRPLPFLSLILLIWRTKYGNDWILQGLFTHESPWLHDMEGFPYGCPMAGLRYEVDFAAPACERAMQLRIRGKEGGAQVPYAYASSGFVIASTRRVPLYAEAPSVNYMGLIRMVRNLQNLASFYWTDFGVVCLWRIPGERQREKEGKRWTIWGTKMRRGRQTGIQTRSSREEKEV